MNNIPQKNIIFENSRNNGLPYYNAGSIQYVGGQNINFATLNNTFQQLIDNDLYVENYIRNYAEHVVGPKSSAPSAVYAGVEGYKAFSDDGVQMHIYRKHENPLSSSVSCVLPDVNANFVSQTGQYVIVGCDEGIYFEQNGFHRLADDIPAYGQYFSDQVNLIASDDGVYSLVMKPGYDISQYHLFIKLNSNNIGVCRSVHYVEETHTIVVGTDNGVYEGDCYSYMLGREDISCKVNFVKMKMLDGGAEVRPEVNALTASGATPIAATSGGIFKPDRIHDFSGYGHVLSGHDIRYRLDDGEKWLVGADDGVYSVAYDYSGNVNKVIDIMNSVAAVSAETGLYLATPDSIFRYANDQLDTLVFGVDGINQLQVYSSMAGDFPIFTSNSAVYYMGNDNDYAELAAIDGARINDILVNGHELFVATTSGIYKYKLYAGSTLYDSEKIVSSVNAYESIIDDDFGPSGLIDINGSLYTYSGRGLKGLSNPTDFIDISVSNCCTFKLDNGMSLIVTTAGQNIRIFDDKLFKHADIQVGSAVQDIKTTDNMVLFRLADKTLWQIHKNKLLDINPGDYLTRITAYSGADDFTTYGEYAAIRQGTGLKFLQEYTAPSQIGKLSEYVVNSLQYNEKYDVVFVSTNRGLSAIDMSVIDPVTSSWAECRIYSDNTYGCWSSEDTLYSFVDDGVDVYDIMRIPQDGENRISCRYRHTVMKKQKLTVNAMCEMDGRQLYATRSGLYASVSAEVYTSRLAWPDNISFCYKTTLSDQDGAKDLFICQDSSGLFRYFDGCSSDQRIINGGAGLVVTGCAMSNYADGCLYIATSSSGLYLYDIQANTLTKCDNIPAAAGVVSISDVKYKAGGSQIFVACVENPDSQGIHNKVFIEVNKGVFAQVALSPSIIDDNQNDQIIRAEFMPTDGINDAQLFIYMKTGLNSGQEYKVKVVSISGNGQIMTDCEVSATLGYEYDQVCASQDRFVYITRSDGVSDGVSAYVYMADAPGEYDARISQIQGVSQIFKDSRGGVYIKKADGYYQAEAGQLRRLLVSDSEFQDRVIGLDYYGSRSGYIIVRTDAGGVGGVYQVEPDDTQVVPIRTNFENKQLYSIQNVFGLIITSYNNKIYWSDVEKVEDLSAAANYNVILNQTAGAVFTGCCVSEETGMAYAYGVKFVLSWQATNRNQFIQNADNYTRETYNNIFNFNIRKIIPHESQIIDVYLNNGVNYNKPYVLLDSGISIYDKNNISMLAKPSAISETAKLFQIPDGIAYLAKLGVMYTTNCESAERLAIRGVALTEKTQGIKYDGKDYYVQADGRWHYIYHGNMALIPGGSQIIDILRLGGFTTYIQDGKIFRFEYAKMRHVTAREYEAALDRYDIYRMFMYGNAPYYAGRSAQGIQLFDERYSPIRIYFADRSGSQFFDNICLAGAGDLIVVRIDGNMYFCKSFSEVAQKYDVRNLAFPVNAYAKNEYTGFDSDDGIVKFNKYGVVNVYKRIDDAPAKFTKILKIGDEDYIVCSSEGLYRYIQDFVYKMSGENTAVGCVYMDMFEGVPGYVIADNSDICRSSDLIDWRIIFSSSVVGDIHDIYVKSLNDYYVATSAGVVKTIYSYQLINDIEQRNEYELQAVVDSLTDDLGQTFENQLDKHLIDWHSSSSQMYFINNKMLSVDMSGIAKDWQNIETGREFVVDNDLVDTMDFGDLSALGCDISTDNSIFSQEYAPADYILKRYMSGVAEMFIHVQTTQTYYLNGVPGSPVPRDESEVVSRKNLESITELESGKKKQNSSVPEHATKITLRIPKQVADISDIHDVQICPCSLPLKVYSDNVDVNDMEKNGIYNSKVIPSIVLSYGVDSDCAVFSFMCFGTDEQSIRLQFTETKKQTTEGFVNVEFYSNGGSGGMPVQRIQIGVQTNLSKTRFVNSGKFFLGWSFQPQADGQRPAYVDGQQVVLSPDEYIDGDVIKLYAVWTAQNIEGDANIFGIESDGSTLYIKDVVEVVPGQTIIDYGDGGNRYIPSDDMPEESQSEPEPEPEIEEDGDYLTDDDILEPEIDDYQTIIDNINIGELDDGSLVH